MKYDVDIETRKCGSIGGFYGRYSAIVEADSREAAAIAALERFQANYPGYETRGATIFERKEKA